MLRNAAIKEGLRAPLFFAAVVLCQAFAFAADTVTQEDLQRCARLPTTELKLACFEALAAVPEAGEMAQSGVEVPADTPQAVSAGGAPEAAAASAAAIAASSESMTSDVKVSEPGLQDTSQVTSESSVAASGASVQPVSEIEEVAGMAPEDPPGQATAAAGEGASQAVGQSQNAPDGAATIAENQAVLPDTGAVAGTTAVAAAPEVTPTSSSPTAASDAEHLEKPADEQAAENESKEILATVNEVTLGHDRRLIFHFDNGQVWRQRKREYIAYPKGEPFDVEVKRGMMGDYRLRVGGEGKMTRIVRVE